MSNIWHKTNEKPMLHRDIILCGDGWSIPMDIVPETVNNICWKNVEKWCYVDDLIKENENTRKALEIAQSALAKLANDAYDMDEHIYIDKTLNQIKTALEQKDK